MNFQDWNFCVPLLWMISIKTNWFSTRRTKWLCKLSFSLVSILPPHLLSFNLNAFDLLDIMLGSYYFQLQGGRSEIVILCIVLQRDESCWLDAQKRNALDCILSLEHYSVCAKDCACYDISQSDWRRLFSFLWRAAWYSECQSCCSKCVQSIYFHDPPKGDPIHKKITLQAKRSSFLKKK